MKQVIYNIDNDLEAARLIEQALTNLPDNYPYGHMASRAFGRLILGRLGLKPRRSITIIPEKEGDIVLIKYEY